MQLYGFNPYLTAPDDPRLRPSPRFRISANIGKEFRGIYGPLLELERARFLSV